ncbi:tetratricopeptide repeat protein [Amycolatopsis kentuckyensis]|uniref:tetratricopeptide repeat protein n=1 Tax=Amycolatopsis kentuckyensis TaxID=218823 RepID=UPI0011776AAE|nr:hypothetical protein [Amycolatopsis kentuckyensis]
MDSELRSAIEHHGEFAEEALQLWFPDAKTYFEKIRPGRSGVELARLDISGDTADLSPGSYVFRVGPTEDDLTAPNEFKAHRLIRQADEAFAADHVPRLFKLHPSSGTGERLVASLHETAGGSLSRYAPPSRESTGLAGIAEDLAHDLMAAWSQPNVIEQVTASELLVGVLGEDRVETCASIVRSIFDGKEVVVEDGHTFMNPSMIFDPADERSLPVMGATVHGDLHIGNLLVPRSESRNHDDRGFWIVDIDQARQSIAGYDLAYLEVSVLVNYYEDIPRPVLSRCLQRAEETAQSPVPDGYGWLNAFLSSSRAGFTSWVKRQPGRSDDLRRQILLTRMIAALRWACRFEFSSAKARMCVAYAAWYATRLHLEFPRPGETAPVAAGSDSDAHVELWESLWHTLSGFAPRAARYVLVAEQLPRQDSLAALGRLPWSAIVDLDPMSDRDGLRAVAGPVLDTQRASHVFVAERPQVDFNEGTAWLLAAGSTLRREPQLAFREWVYQRLDAVRQLTASLHSATGDVPIVVVLLAGGTDNAQDSGRDRMLKVVDVMDEMLRGAATFIHVGVAQLEPPIPVNTVPLPVQQLLDRLAETVGSSATERSYGLPTISGKTVPIAPDTLQSFQEHLNVLHRDIDIMSPSAGQGGNDAFWRGGLISWADLEAGIDVSRSVHAPLVSALQESLDSHRTRTVVLEHQPGAGGTTVALRAAWDLHQLHPVAVLRSGVAIDAARVPLIADRLHKLFVITQRPVLLVADGSDLSEPYREALYREVASRGARVTMLYVRRVLRPRDDAPLAVSEPLNDVESDAFGRRYAQLTDDKHRKDELRLLQTPSYAKYRTPFFYGLITFEREFTKLEGYVRTHVSQIRGRVREVLQYLALATIFSNTGLQVEVLQKLMRISRPNADISPDDLVGPEAARLITVRAGRVRLLHQLLAEQVLSELLGDGGWEHHLKDLAIDLVEALAMNTDPAAEPVRVLLRQMFVDRQGGMVDGTEDRGGFAPLIERLDDINPSLGHQVLKTLTDHVPEEPHFWNHLGRHQMYRLERDLDKAEEYVGKAVELSPHDALHHHTLGLARRSRMRQEIRRARHQGLHAMLTVTDEWFSRTVECFTTARDLSPDNIYGYITHVQAIVDVARNLKEMSDVRSVAELTADAGEWVMEHLTVANELLGTAAHLYGTLDQRDNYMTRCEADIRSLYHDLDSVVALWERAAASTRSSPTVRRALAQAYYVRGNRSWRELTTAELYRIVELANNNLARQGNKEEDYRLWFEAYKLLPDFDVEEAISKLHGWSSKFPSWRAHYYKYCLHFYLWFQGRTNDTERFRLEQQLAQKHMLGRTKRSHLWLAKSPGWFPLVAETDLGPWSRPEGFWSDTSLLQRVNGVIDYIDGPQAGWIQLAPGATAFFVPSVRDFQRDSDENEPVNFFVGFSPEGLRAWDVERGHSPAAVDARADDTVAADRLSPRPVQDVPKRTVSRRAEEIGSERVVAFCVALLEVHRSVDETPLSFLEVRVKARFRDDSIDLKRVLGHSPQVVLTPDSDPVVHLVDGGDGGQNRDVSLTSEGRLLGRILFLSDAEHWGLITLDDQRNLRFEYSRVENEEASGPPVRGQVVRCVSVMGPRGADARDVELLPKTSSLVDGEVVPVADLAGRIESDLRAEFERRLAGDETHVRLADLRDWLESRYPAGSPLAARLGVKTLDQLWDQYHWMIVSGKNDGKRARLRNGVAFGRLPLDAPGADAPRADGGNAPLDDFATVLGRVVRRLHEPTGKWPQLKRVDREMRTELGSRFRQVVGGSLQDRIAGAPGWKLAKWRVVPVSGQTAASTKAPGSFGGVLAEVFNDVQRAGTEPSLQVLGGVLRQRMGQEAYASEVGSSLKRRIEREAGWSVTEVRPGVYVLSGSANPPGSPGAVSELGDHLEKVVAELESEGLPLAMTSIGGRLRARMAEETYQAMVGKSLHKAVIAWGWTVAEIRPGYWVMSRTP